MAEVTLSAWANVQLLSSSEHSNFKAGRRYRGTGGLAKRSPVRLQIPRDGHWYATVDTRGLRNGTSSSARVIRGSALRPLPPIRERRSEISEVLSNAAISFGDDESKDFDLFISHASEDKDSIVRPLAEALRSTGLEVWYDEFELKVGDSLRRKIDQGIARSRFGLVVLSKSFFAKDWPNYELDGLVTMSVSGRQVLLPVWHEISKDEVMSHSPSLADRVALRTSDYGVGEIAAELADVIASREGVA